MRMSLIPLLEGSRSFCDMLTPALPVLALHGWIALGLGIVFSVVIGCGLMVLMFYSSGRGYDDAASFTRDKR